MRLRPVSRTHRRPARRPTLERLEPRTLLARAERLYQQLRGQPRDYLGAHIRRYEQVLESQDRRAIDPIRADFERVLNDIEDYNYTNPV